ncbi:Mur ligase family protein [Wenzhouxiangella sp. EGI_FJ10305]|uniref:Mur ligase family protein n=1 Tax=Wenzhouxiangella sp. EGI_FJ10305 TaxID=3243768 RepID=UPI0035DF4CA5
MKSIRHFLLAGYHRHADVPICKVVLECDEHELDAMSAGRDHELERIVQLRIGEQDSVQPTKARESDPNARPEERLAWVFASACITLQRRIGHRIGRHGVAAGGPSRQARAWFEYDHAETAFDVCELIEMWLNVLLDPDEAAREEFHKELPGRIEQLCRDHSHRRMPADAHAIDTAARSRDIPCQRLDRPPCDPIEGDFRLRPHGLLRLGQGWRQHTVDGTFCVSRCEAAYPLIRDRRKRFDKLKALEVPLAGAHPEARWCTSAVRAVRAARRIGRPVVLRALRSGSAPEPTASAPLEGEDAVLRAAESLLDRDKEILVEPHIQGDRWFLPVAGGRAGPEIISIDRNGERSRLGLDEIDGTLLEHCEATVRELDVGLAVVRFVAPGLNLPLAESGGAVVDIDLAPRLEDLFDADSAELAELAERFVDWLYPDPARARIPVFAVTGTNGKTTTTRLLASILRQFESGVGLACSDGSDVDGESLSSKEHGYLPGHLTVIDHPGTRIAVLESTRGGAVSTGQGYDRSVAAACLNVSEDHLNDHLGIRDLEEMAVVKRGIVDCAEQAVILNADDPRCLDMTGSLNNRRIGLFSLNDTGERLLARTPDCEAAATAEDIDGVEWLTLHTASGRITVAPVADIPVCFQGRARHNVANALAAIVLAHFAGADSQAMARGLEGLGIDFESQHGRLNFVDGLPFTLIMDYAHNPDGILHLAEFAARTPTKGRRILNFSCSAGNSDDFIRKLGRAAAGAFDLYVCKPFTLKYHRELEEVPRLLREGLQDAGVAADSIIVRDEEMDSIAHTLELARPGDLVVVIAGKMSKRQIWNYLFEWRTRQGDSP